MGSRTIPGGLLEFSRTSSQLQTVALNSGGPASAACGSDEVRIIEYVEMVLSSPTQEPGYAILRFYGQSGNTHHATTVTTTANVNAVPANVPANASADMQPTLWEPGVTAALYVYNSASDAIAISYRSVPLSVAIDRFGYVPSVL